MKGDNWINGFCNSVKYDMRMRWDFGRKIQFILPREREINRSLNQCLLQLWTGSACRMTSRGGDRHWRRNRFIKACSNKFSNKNTIYSKLNKWINQNQCSKHQSSFCLVSLIWNLFLIKVWSPPCHSARSRRQSRRTHHPKNNPCPGKGGTVADSGWGSDKNSFLHPSSALAGTFSLGSRSSFANWNSGFCNSGQALRAEWHEGEVGYWKKNPVY